MAYAPRYKFGHPREDIIDMGMFAHQADATLSQVNPTTGTVYSVLAVTTNVRIISIEAAITWPVNQPNPLDIIVTVDGQTVTFRQVNPVSGAGYEAAFNQPETLVQGCVGTGTGARYRSFLLEGKSVQVSVSSVFAGAPTLFESRVKWARKV